MSNEKNMEEKLAQIASSGQTHYIQTKLTSDLSICEYLYYAGRVLKSIELRYELEYLISNADPEAQRNEYELASIFQFPEVPKEKIVLASWYDGEREEDAFRRTEEWYLLGERKDIHAIIMFLHKRDEEIEPQKRYMYVRGRFASEEEGRLPVFHNAKRLCCESIRDLFMYVFDNSQLSKLGIEVSDS